MPSEQRRLYLVTGIEHSGKSTFTSYLSGQGGYPVIAPDNIIFDIYAFVQGTPENPMITDRRAEIAACVSNVVKMERTIREWSAEETVARMGRELEKGDAIVDGKYLTAGSRAHLIAEGKRSRPDMLAQAYWMDVDVEECVSRFDRDPAGKSAYMTEGMIRESHARAEPPTHEEDLEKIFFVRGPEGKYEIEELTL